MHSGLPVELVGWQTCRGEAVVQEDDIQSILGFNNNLARFAALLVVLTLVATPLFADSTARIEGRVEDTTGAVVPNDMVVPPLAMALGVPAKIRPDALPEGAHALPAAVYVDNGRRYREELRRIDI